MLIINDVMQHIGKPLFKFAAPLFVANDKTNHSDRSRVSKLGFLTELISWQDTLNLP
jgi:hypothetical protein